MILVFGLFTLAGYVGAFVVTSRYLNADIVARSDEAVAAFATIAQQAEIEERVVQTAATANPVHMLLSYTTGDGRRIGNVPGGASIDGLEGVVSDHVIGGPPRRVSETYVARTVPLGNGVLTLLVSREALEELPEIFAAVLVLSLVPALLLATFIGSIAASTARDRVEAIRAALTDLTSGRLDARVPVGSAPPDDLGEIALAVNRMAAAQEGSIAALRQVSADIAHDLRTPIQRVAVLLERLEAEALTETGRTLVAGARDETALIVETFRALLQIAQIEGGQARNSFTQVDLSRLAADMVDVYTPSADDSGHALVGTIAPDVVVEGERTLLGRLIANLLENALRHTPGGTIRLTLENGPMQVLSIADDGPGIPAAERALVLRRLYRLERSRSSDGSGLGLALVAAIADLHGATLDLGDAGPGLQVTVTFGGDRHRGDRVMPPAPARP